MTQGIYFTGPQPILAALGCPLTVLVSPLQWAGIERVVPRQLVQHTWEIVGTLAHDICAEAREQMTIDGAEFECTRLYAGLKEYLSIAIRITLSWEDEAAVCSPSRTPEEFLSTVEAQLLNNRKWAVNAIFSK